MDRITLFVADREQAWIQRALVESHCRVECARDWTHFVRISAAAGAAVCALPVLGAGVSLADLREFGASQPSCPLVLVTSRDPDNLARLASVQVAGVAWIPDRAVAEPQSMARLRELVRIVLLAESRFEAAARLVTANSYLDRRLARALRFVLRQTPADELVERDDRAAPVHDVTELASRLDISSKALAAADHRAGIDLHAFILDMLTLRAILLRATTRLPWEQVAWRLGYSSCSGLSMLVRRSVGRGLRDLDMDTYDELWVRVRDRYLHSLAG